MSDSDSKQPVRQKPAFPGMIVTLNKAADYIDRIIHMEPVAPDADDLIEGAELLAEMRECSNRWRKFVRGEKWIARSAEPRQP